MKIPGSIRAIFLDREPLYSKLKQEVDRRLVGFKDPRWHYESRVKVEESFALKVETGRVSNPAQMEDFFAATYVVPNLSAIDAAEQIVRSNFAVLERRPAAKGSTHKAPESFPFDDVRLFAAIASDPRYPDSGLEGLRFEIQVKTFLQHAWSIATHDLIYKASGVSWAQERIAYQVKAMLEHAEVSIEEASALSKSSIIAKTDKNIRTIGEIIKFVRELWADDAPRDIKRLAMNIADVCATLDITVLQCEEAVRALVAANGGAVPVNVSPYLAIVEAVAATYQAKLTEYLYRKNPRKNDKRILITREITLPAGIEKAKMKRAIVVE
ncbi:hypothetical protein LB545_30490 [Mesorhizobium sp. BR1-1-6]|uniref:hypothetical protein n=1 Tax=Mesorhizobium sp. BR1-1-6 TaxID=2876648 RepID=UPI001CD0B754|nr:hypothetical protein [Mesorhizobium sp. BR1-1-6]MBZ9898641.1 hypothetical protein [Mesorhizobium sp. BR1-1-6]